VTLKGEVPNTAAAYQVINAVRNVPGVKLVDSTQLTLKSKD
jgi:osmotically-inducible protein OsmY